MPAVSTVDEMSYQISRFDDAEIYQVSPLLNRAIARNRALRVRLPDFIDGSCRRCNRLLL